MFTERFFNGNIAHTVNLVRDLFVGQELFATTVRKLTILKPLTLLLAGAALLPASSLVTVPGTSGPWLYQQGGLNSGYQYGIGDEGAPAVVSASNGLPFITGDLLTFTYVSGAVDPYSCCFAEYHYDANGTGVQNGDPGGTSGTLYPSAFIPTSEWPVGAFSLVGVFTDPSGLIVAAPDKVGDGPISFVIPAGATQFQLGVNDEIYADNLGSWVIGVTEGSGAIPEPSTAALLCAAAALGLIGAHRRNRSAKRWS